MDSSEYTQRKNRNRSADVWKRYPNPELVTRGPGLPATHIDELPNECRKVVFWSRHQGAQTFSVFEDKDAGEYYVHAVVSSNDWVHGPFQTLSDAKDRLEEMKDGDRHRNDTIVV